MKKICCFVVGGILGIFASLCFTSSFLAAFENWLFSGDFFKMAISTALGGALTAYVSFKTTKINNLESLERLEKELEFKNKQWANDECKKYCLEYLSVMAPDVVPEDLHNRSDVNRLIFAIGVFADTEYYHNVIRLKKFAIDNFAAISRESLKRGNSPANNVAKEAFEAYVLEHGKLIGLTSYMFGILKPDTND